MAMRQLCIGALLALAGACAAPGAAACERVPLVSPARGATLADRQPVLAWTGSAQQRHRVQIAVVLPEARVLASHDLDVVGTSLRLPAPVAAERAGIKVLVTRDCPQSGAAELQAQGAWFFVDARGDCALDGASLRAAAGGLEWAAVARAQRYTVRLFRGVAADGEPLALAGEFQVSEPRWSGAAADGTARVATVQPVCEGIAGPPAALALPGR
jgi:hypothetical protein